MKSRLLVLIFMVLLVLLAACDPSPGKFNLYLVAEKISHDEVVKGDLANLRLDNQPLIAEEDIIWYDPERHEMELTDETLERIKSLQIPVSGGPDFVVCVGPERIYGGAFWTPVSSMSFDGVVIWPMLDPSERTIRIQPGNPSSEWFQGEDPRADRRILRALRQAGKLRETQLKE